jgi:hypothetical protein
VGTEGERRRVADAVDEREEEKVGACDAEGKVARKRLCRLDRAFGRKMLRGVFEKTSVGHLKTDGGSINY